MAPYVTFCHEVFVKGPAIFFTNVLEDMRLDGLLTLITMTYGRLGDLFLLLRYLEQLQESGREFNAHLETASYGKMKDWRTLLNQYLHQQNRIPTEENKTIGGVSARKNYVGIHILTDLAVIGPLLLVFGLQEIVTVVYGPVMPQFFSDVKKKGYRNQCVLYVNLVSVVDRSVLNWVKQPELRKKACDDRLFGKIAEPGWVMRDSNNQFKCRMGC